MKATRNVAKVQLALEATTRDFLREAHDKVLRTFGDLLYDFCWGGELLSYYFQPPTSNLQPPTGQVRKDIAEQFDYKTRMMIEVGTSSLFPCKSVIPAILFVHTIC